MNTLNEIKMGKLPENWKDGRAKSITFSVTEECNLACKYCYMTGKNSKNRMSIETAKKAVDYLLSNRELFNEEGAIWEFVGGEPFLEIEMIDELCDYIKHQMYILDHPWFDAYRFNFSSNGMLYHTPAVQKYIEKNKGHLSIGMSVDGNKIKHDMQRVKVDGSGSYDDVLKNVPLWQKQFPDTSTKATFAHDDLPYLKDSIISLWENGIKIVSANVVYEDGWHEGDDIIYENQLRELADYILENRLWNEFSVRFFDPHIGFPIHKDDLKRNYCGAGKMLAIDYKGRFFPCLRFLDFTLNNREGLCVGDVDNGINTDKVRPFLALTVQSQSKQECLECDVASGCGWCTGLNYDLADTPTIYQRATFICKMHKANVRANKYFWNKFEQVAGITSPREKEFQLKTGNAMGKKITKYLQFITSDNITPHCTYRNHRGAETVMSNEVLERGLKFAEQNDFVSVFLGSVGDNHNIFNIVDGKSNEFNDGSIIVCDNSCTLPEGFEGNCILLVSKSNISELSNFVKELSPHASRVNIILENIEAWSNDDIEMYKAQLVMLADFVLETYKNENPIEINLLTDILNLKSMTNCDAGNNTFSLAPNGKIYICPAFYFDNPDDYVGDMENGIHIKNEHLLEFKNAPVCNECDTYHCRRCKYLNRRLTNEINTPSKIQCVISHIERNISKKLQAELIRQNLATFDNVLEDINYIDPLEKLIKKY